eukprot:4554-Eustigmatos_ZCMA.PRE.1
MCSESRGNIQTYIWEVVLAEAIIRSIVFAATVTFCHPHRTQKKYVADAMTQEHRNVSPGRQSSRPAA